MVNSYGLIHILQSENRIKIWCDELSFLFVWFTFHLKIRIWKRNDDKRSKEYDDLVKQMSLGIYPQIS